MPRSPEISPAMEDYLEAILGLARDGGQARVRDIALALDVSRPSVSGAIRTLSEQGLVNHKPYEAITLTRTGAVAARRIMRRHAALWRFFRDGLGVPDETADRDACRIEHVVSRETVDRLVALMEFLESRPRVVRDWTRVRGADHGGSRRADAGRSGGDVRHPTRGGKRGASRS